MTTAVLIPLAWLIVGLLVVVILLLIALLHRTPRDRGHRPTHQPVPRQRTRREPVVPAHPTHDGATSVDLRAQIGRSSVLYQPGRSVEHVLERRWAP